MDPENINYFLEIKNLISGVIYKFVIQIQEFIYKNTFRFNTHPVAP